MPRLVAALVVSLAIHGLPLGLGARLVRPRALDLDLDMEVHAVEIGLEEAHPGALVRPPPPTPAPTTEPPPAPEPERPREHPHRHAEAPREPSRPAPVPRETTPNGDPVNSLSDLLNRRLPEPSLRRPAIERRINDDRLALRPPDHAADAGANDAATTASVPDVIPTVATAMGDAAPLVPRGALLTVTVRTDRVRDNPNARALGEVFRSIPDWDEMLGGTELDPVRDLDSLTLAAAQPFGTATEPPDWFVLAKGAQGNDDGLRRAIEQMARRAAPPAPSPVAPGFADGGGPDALARAAMPAPAPAPRPTVSSGAQDDASATPSIEDQAAGEGGGQRTGDGAVADPYAGEGDGGSIWQSASDGGYHVATFRRYFADRSFVMLGDGMAAIALPGQVDALLSAMARRGPPQEDATDPRLLALIEANGVRNLLSFNTWHGPFPVPSRATLALYGEADDEGRQTGATQLLSRWQYDNAQQAEHARREMEYSRGRWHVLIDASFGNQGGLGRFVTGLVASGVAGVDIGALERAIDALQFDTEGDKLRVRARLDRGQVRSVLNLLSMRSRLNLDALGGAPP